MFNITCSSHKKASHYAYIDYLRGIALLLMFIYHFSFDLNYYHFINVNFYNNPFWINFRIVIVSLFLWLVGVSLWLANQSNFKLSRILKRIGMLIIAAALVSYFSYLTFPRSYIFFGILHFIIVASLIGLLFIRLYYTNLLIGTLLIIIGTKLSSPLFNQAELQWFGLMTHKPLTEDYVPFLPWFGVILMGIFSGQFIFKWQHLKFISRWRERNSLQKNLSCMGRYSLIIYLLHQPLFMGILFVFNLMLH